MSEEIRICVRAGCFHTAAWHTSGKGIGPCEAYGCDCVCFTETRESMPSDNLPVSAPTPAAEEDGFSVWLNGEGQHAAWNVCAAMPHDAWVKVRDLMRITWNAREALIRTLTAERDAGVEKGIRMAAEENIQVRRQLWLSHGCSGLYGDDGEMQCSCFHPFIDFKDEPMADVLRKIRLHCELRYAATLPAPPKSPQPEEVKHDK